MEPTTPEVMEDDLPKVIQDSLSLVSKQEAESILKQFRETLPHVNFGTLEGRQLASVHKYLHVFKEIARRGEPADDVTYSIGNALVKAAATSIEAKPTEKELLVAKALEWIELGEKIRKKYEFNDEHQLPNQDPLQEVIKEFGATQIDITGGDVYVQPNEKETVRLSEPVIGHVMCNLGFFGVKPTKLSEALVSRGKEINQKDSLNKGGEMANFYDSSQGDNMTLLLKSKKLGDDVKGVVKKGIPLPKDRQGDTVFSLSLNELNLAVVMTNIVGKK